MSIKSIFEETGAGSISEEIRRLQQEICRLPGMGGCVIVAVASRPRDADTMDCCVYPMSSNGASEHTLEVLRFYSLRTINVEGGEYYSDNATPIKG